MFFVRSLVVVLIAALIAFQPKFAPHTEEPQMNRIVVAIDLSEPMHVADPQRTPVEKLQFARSLDLADGLCSNQQLDTWIEEYQRVEKEKGTEFRWVGEDEFKNEQPNAVPWKGKNARNCTIWWSESESTMSRVSRPPTAC